MAHFTNRYDFTVTNNRSVHTPACHTMQTIVHFKVSKYKGGCQGVKEMRFRGDTLLTGVLLFERGANRSAEGVSIWSLTCEICLSRAFPSSRAYRETTDGWVCTDYAAPHQPEHGARIMQVHSHHCSHNSAERRGTPRRRACSWNSTDPGSAGLCWPLRALVVPGKMRVY